MTDADYIEQLEIKAESLEDDNKALRELLKNALIDLSSWVGYGRPRWMIDRARELGVEVDE